MTFEPCCSDLREYGKWLAYVHTNTLTHTRETFSGGNSEGGKSPAGKVKKVTLPKDPHAPKKPLTAYNLYAADQRVKV